MLYMYFANGFEETEAIAALDVLRRANINVFTVGVGSKNIKGAHDVEVRCDLDDNEATFTGLEGVILPGGMPGTKNLDACEKVQNALDFCSSTGKLTAAICAAPMILGKKGLLKGKKATCYPGFENYLEGAEVSSDFVVTDGTVITAKGMGAAVEFGLAIVAYFKGKAFAQKIKNSLMCYYE